MRNYELLLELLEEHSIVSMKEMSDHLPISERNIRERLKNLRGDGRVNGFSIVTVSNEGYYLKISDQEAYGRYKQKLNRAGAEDVSNMESRVSLILFLLLQSEGYTSRGQIAEMLDVSRNTIINDMEYLRARLSEYNIRLESKPHYGIRVTGSEKDIRKMLSKVSGNVLENTLCDKGFFEFVEDLEFWDETARLIFILDKYNVSMTSNALESVLFHLKILLYRIQQNNYVSDISINAGMIDGVLFCVAKEILQFIGEKHGVVIPEAETNLVVSQIYGKANIMSIESAARERMEENIYDALVKVDQDYATDFHNNEMLRENLLFHICPLIMRVSFDLELQDPLLNTVSVQYMNVFLIAMRFIDYHAELKGHKLSRDEIGYLALHFASILEMEHQEKIQQVRRVMLITDQMRSSTVLIKTRLQSVFPMADILDIPFSKAVHYCLDEMELIISTIELELPVQEERLVVIDKNCSEHAIRKIKNKVLFSDLGTAGTLSLEDLFYENLFMVRSEGDYHVLVKEMCRKMMDLGYAQQGFGESVMAREARFTTVVDNGVAFPHSLIQMASKDSVGVIVLNPPLIYEKNEIRCIFVLNIKKGHHYLQQDIGNLILRLMDDPAKVKRLQKSATFKEFIFYIKKIAEE